MQLTKEERAKLAENLSAINEYIAKEIIPHLEGSYISVPFKPKKLGFHGENETEFRLCVDRHGVTGSCGYLGMNLVPNPEEPNATTFSSYSSAGIALLENWPIVKDTLLKHVEAVKEQKSLIQNFAV